jgi:nucleoside-diphosphate-sugar epimerase
MVPAIDFFNNKTIIITGGGGYLGSKLAEKLAESTVSLYLFDIKFNPVSKSLVENHSNVKLIEVNLTQKVHLSKATTKAYPDYVFHFAANLNRDRDFKIYPTLYDVNVEGTFNLLEALKDIPYRGLYFASSSEVYGSKNPVPFSEDQLPAPVSPYSLSKLIAEQLIQTYSKTYNKPYTVLRLFNFFGSGMPEHFFINQLLESLKADKPFNMTYGEQVRDFTFIDDVLDAIIGISSSEKSLGEVINICSGNGIRLSDLALEIGQRYNKTHLIKFGALPYRDNEIFTMIGSTGKLSSYYTVSPGKGIDNFFEK